ncbi:hypothetical protein [Psychroflexus sp. MES1-P1E]|uniref:hypothetical protein n=1 Tax=Psychroflexus sp. MES1-P1E TaxID=2058320 RepID=UPI0015E0C10A|nr:hypothetical protein [Psychroflexus sp. MES1-P1E]
MIQSLLCEETGIIMTIALENSGLSLLKGNSDYSDWQKIKAQGRQTVDVDCN